MNTELDSRVRKNYEDIVARVAEQAGVADSLIKLCGFVATVVLPTVIGFVFAFWQSLFVSFDVFVRVALGMIIFQFALGVIITRNLVNIERFQSAAAGLKHAYDEIKSAYIYEAETGQILGETVEYTEDYMGALPIYEELIEEDIGNFKEAVSELMDYFIENREPLFGIKRGDLWNFAVYVYCEEKNLLLPIWRKCVPSLWNNEVAETRAIRAFGPCDGHVGAAFRRGEPIITANAQDPTIQAFCEPPRYLCRDDDVANYSSFASFPLESGNSIPNGVLVATNNRTGTYTPKNCLAFRPAAYFISRLTEKVPVEKWPNLALPRTDKVE
ncbi:MAG: hypothetical protein GC152_15760 [Alphaproteobacteria bacterium]|nr:hypothetical protein [Alphaproteobacteria bacterium]